jgi:hypothetical protein
LPHFYPAHFWAPRFVPAAVVFPPFRGVARGFELLAKRFGPVEVVFPDFFLSASMNPLFAGDDINPPLV